MGYKVFLSHTAADGPWVKWIAQNAQSVGIEVYLYEHDPKPGQTLATKVQAAIRNSDVLVVLLTTNSQFAPYVHQEIGSAKALQKRIVPLVQPGIDERSLAMLQGIEHIPFDFGNPQPGLVALLNYLQTAKLTKERNQALLAFGALIAGALLAGGGR